MTRNQTSQEFIQQSFVVYTHDAPAELPERDQPVMRVLRDGPAACNTAELLQALIGGPKAEFIARELLSRYATVGAVANAPVVELMTLASGLGEKGAIRLKAALELGRRTLSVADARPQIKSPAAAAEVLTPEMAMLEQEEVRTLLLNTRNRLIAMPLIYLGSLNSCSMRVGELFKHAIRHNAAAIIVAHNHPSGDPTPSAEDIRVTKSLLDASKLLDCELLDHIVIAPSKWISMKEKGLGFS